MKVSIGRGLIFAAVLIVATACIAAIKKTHSHADSTADLPSYEWTKEPWTGSDETFVKIRQDTDQIVANTKKEQLDDLVEAYRKQAEGQPDDPHAQFAWGYVTYQALISGYKSHELYHDLQDISFALDKAKSPQAAEYARLRFFIIIRWQQESFKLKDLAQRLIKRDPNDYEVNYYAISTLQRRSSIEGRKQALKYAQDAVRLRPERPNAYSALGAVYTDICLYDDDVSACDKALDSYAKLYKMTNTPIESRDKLGVDYWIKRVKDHKAELVKEKR